MENQFVSYFPNPNLSVPAYGRREGALRVDDKVKKAVVFLGTVTEKGFVPYGTAFMTFTFIGESGFQQLVTAKHVIEKIPPGPVHARVNRKDGGFQTVALAREHWWPHPDPRVDIAVCPSLLDVGTFDILHLDLHGEMIITDDAVREHDIGAGDEVFVAGMYISRVGENRNIPVLRIGNIAAMSEEPMHTIYGYHETHLIEVRSIGGLSGSPVFIHRAPVQSRDGKMQFQHGQMQYLMGVLLGHHSTFDPVSSIAAPVGEDEVEVVANEINTGIGLVAPIHYVREAVEQPDLVAKRVETLEKRKREDPNKFVPDAGTGLTRVVAAASSPAKNPTHKEDFTALLDAAVGKPKQDD